MSKPVALDPGPYSGTYKMNGGAECLDFANLVSYRGFEQQHDWLEPVSNLDRWAQAAGIDAPVRDDFSELLVFREVLNRTFLAIADHSTPSANDIETIGYAATVALSVRRLSFEPGKAAATWTTARPSLLSVIALDAASLLTSAESLERIGACEECRWLFLDTTKNRSRNWCDPADCGNRARQRRHYQRQRGI